MTDLPASPDPATAPAEPLLTVGVITAAVVALLSLLVAFGVRLSDDRQSAILAVLAVAAPAVVALVGRARVYSPKTVGRLLAAARRGPTSL